jgi:hypothetical protein
VAVHRAQADLATDRAGLGESDALPRGCRVDREDAQEASFRSAAVRNPGSLYFPIVATKKVGEPLPEHVGEGISSGVGYRVAEQIGSRMGVETRVTAPRFGLRAVGPKTMDLEHFAEAEVFFG